MSDNIVPAGKYSLEAKIANSRFISSIGPASSVADAKNFILEVKRDLPDANHHVPAYIIGSGSSVISHCSDDGEPSGTAGRPSLAVLTGSGLGDTVLVITRYFGGTKLGTGGLVKAYSNSARLAVEGVQKARKIKVHTVQLESHYKLYEKVSRSIIQNEGSIEKKDFTDNVKIEFSIPVLNFDTLKLALTEMSHGKIELEVLDKNLIRIIPL